MRVLLFIYLQFIMCVANAQSHKFIQYTTADGLPSATVYGILQDSKGYMWFSTPNGVCRFDGRIFQTFTIRDGLTENFVNNLFEDLHKVEYGL